MLWAVESHLRIIEMGTGGVATEGCRELLPKSRREGRGKAFASCQKIAETTGEIGANVSYDGLQENDRNEGREGSVASYQELP